MAIGEVDTGIENYHVHRVHNIVVFYWTFSITCKFSYFFRVFHKVREWEVWIPLVIQPVFVRDQVLLQDFSPLLDDFFQDVLCI